MNPIYLTEQSINPPDGFEEIALFDNYKNIIDEVKDAVSDQRVLHDIEIHETLFWHTIKYLIKNNIPHSLTSQTWNEPFKPQSSRPTWELLEKLFASNENPNLPSWQDVESFFEQLDSLEKGNIVYYFFARFNFSIENEQQFQAVDKFLNSYYKITGVGDFLRFYWPGLSTGQQAFFSLFSRFYEARTKIKDYMLDINEYRANHGMSQTAEKPNVVILIDEGETNLHPQWQKEFLYYITTYLPKIIDSNRIQFILTSNSPFLVSDLPQSNIIFLKSENEKTIVQTGFKTSFAGNIHDLLADSFFLDAPIGRFAENKIDDAIKWLKEKNSSSNEADILKLIYLIDDPIVQNKLLQMYSLKVNHETWEESLLNHQRTIIDIKLKKIREGRGDNAEN